MAASRRLFAKLDPGFYSNRKVIRAGRNGREIYQFVLCLNAAKGAHGWVSEEDIEPWYLADQLRISEQESRDGVRDAIAAGLIRVAEGRVCIAGWDDDWSRLPKSEAQRSRDYRERVTNRHDELVTRHEENTPSPIRGEERRGERGDRDSLSASLGDSRSESTGATARSGTTGSSQEELLPNDWVPPTDLVGLASQLGCDLAHEVATFRAHQRKHRHRAHDWNAGFDKWLRGSRDKGKHKPPKPGATTTKPRRHRQVIDGKAFVENERGDLEPEVSEQRESSDEVQQDSDPKRGAT